MRCLMIALLVCLPAFGSAAAKEYRDDNAGYRVTLPAGWIKNDEISDADGTLFESPRAAQTLGVCLIASEATPETRNASQAELDAGFAGKFNEAFWRAAFAEMKEVTVETAAEDVQDGRKIYVAVLSYKTDESHLKVKGVLHVVPGQLHILYCAAEYAAYPVEEPDIEAFLKSFVPAGTDLVVSVQPYARPVVGRRPVMNHIFEEARAGAGTLGAATARKTGRRR